MFNLLDNFSDPQVIKSMSLNELDVLSEEIREFLIESVSKTGGHLAPNLGVVELTIALHNIFDFSKDKIVFDVGHQSYVHKILTGRKNEFNKLRQFNGLSGFPKTEESPYDHFNTGHASTSISAALGMARARDIKGEKHNVVCVIGDGALTGGMAWEALNDVGDRKTRLIIVLNDNEMSISRNVGGVSQYLSQVRSDALYEKLKKDVKVNLEKMPLGKPLSKSVKKVKDSVKAMMVEGMIFENMGIKYLGPVDGHNIKSMSKILESAKNHDGPVLVHAITQKGKGYEFAVEKPDLFHGIAPFDTKNGTVTKKSSVTYSKVFGDTLLELAKKDNKVVAITAAMRDGTGLKEFSKLQKEQFFDVGIAEEHAVTLSGGMAIAGLKPYVAIYSTFLQRSLDQLIHDIALQKLNVTFCIDRAGIVGDDGETHQGIFDLSYLSFIPNMTVIAPKCTEELRNVLNWAYDYNAGPLAIRYPRGGDGQISFNPLTSFEIGKWEVIKDIDLNTNNKDVVIISNGKLLEKAYKVSNKLNEYNIAIVNTTFIKPIDEKLIEEYIKNFKLVITLEDNVIKGGVGESVLTLLNKLDFKGKIVNLGYKDTYVNQGDIESLYKLHGLSETNIENIIKDFFNSKK